MKQKLTITQDISWLGNIPIEWEIKPMKHILNERKEINNPIKVDRILSLLKDVGVIPYEEKGDIGNKSKEDISSYKIAYPNDIVMNSMNVIIGSVGLSKYLGCISPVYYALYSEENNIEYYNFIFQTSQFQKQVKKYADGIMEIRLKINPYNLFHLKLPVPSLSEQNIISSFLTDKCSNIDDVVKDIEMQIDTLEKYKKSVIFEAVTKGLNHHVEMKESGIDWIGSIPKHWDTIRVKYVVKIFNGKEIGKDEGEIPVYGSGGLFKYTDKWLYEGISVLLGRKGTIDKPQIVDGKFWTVDTAFYTKFSRNINPNFFYYLATCFNYEKYQTGSAIPSMTQSVLDNIVITKVKLEEQNTIVTYLNAKCLEIDSIIKDKKTQINTIKMYKNSLIYEYVTGKKRVGQGDVNE